MPRQDPPSESTQGMPHTSEAEGEEQRRNAHLQGDKHRKAQKTGHGVPPSEQEATPEEPPVDDRGGLQSGGSRGR